MRFATVLLAALWTAIVLSHPAARGADPAAEATTKPAGALPSEDVPDGLGVNIHFTEPRPGEMKELAEAGFTRVRMDFAWGATERVRGEYDFAAYDRLMAALGERKIKPVFILDYGNALYDEGLSPHTDAGRAAFAKWAAAGVGHFKGRGIIWEMWNEPNIGFWKPRPDAEAYAKLALATGRAIREAAAEETFVGPATSEIDPPFLETCFKAGLLEYWSAVSVHPYRQKDPETVADDYRAVRLLIARYAPKGKKIHILSGEWGYSAGWDGFTEERQGKYLPREWLVNLANEVPLSIWYDWHDDGTDPKESEHHFGTVHHEYKKDADPVFEPKPAYVAAQALVKNLAGYRYNKRLVIGDSATDYLLLFSKGPEVKLVAWTTSATPRPAVLPASAGAFAVVDYLGRNLPALSADEKGLAVVLTDSPLYLKPEKSNDLLALAAAWERAPLETIQRATEAPVWLGLNLTNPLADELSARGGTQDVYEGRAIHIAAAATEVVPTSFRVSRNDQTAPLRLQLYANGVGALAQETRVIVTNPLRIIPLPPAEGKISVRIENPAGEQFAGRAALAQVAEGHLTPAVRVDFAAGEMEKTVQVPFDFDPTAACRFGVRIDDRYRNLVATLPARLYTPIASFNGMAEKALDGAWVLGIDGDPKVASQQSLAIAAPPEGPVAPGVASLAIKYDFEAGHKFIFVAPQRENLRKLPVGTTSLSMWIYGDGSGNFARIRFTDATGQTFQPTARLEAKGWRHLSFPLTGEGAGSWGGAKDGKVHGPIKLDTLLLIDSARGEKTGGTVYIAGPTATSD